MIDEDAATTDDKGRESPRLQSKFTPPKEDFFMGLCFMFGAMCKDPAGQEAALIVDNNDRWLASGVNFIEQPDNYGQNKAKFGWEIEDRETAMIHAVDAVMDRALKMYIPGTTTLGPFHSHTLYTTGPITTAHVKRCNGNGLKDIIYGPLKSLFFDEGDWQRAQKLADLYRMKLKAYSGNLNWMRDRTESLAYLF
jgi:hypothetical protein